MDDSTSKSTALFAALGTIVGYLATEVGSSTIFERMLWPSRFYNGTFSFSALLGIVLLMPTGGPIHKGAVDALDSFTLRGLWTGRQRGDMLGSAFYGTRDHKYVVRKRDGTVGEQKDARNAFWIHVLTLLPYQSEQPKTNDEEANTRKGNANIRHVRPIFRLNLSWYDACAPIPHVKVISGDLSRFSLQSLCGVLASELITITCGVVTIVKFGSLYCVWYFAPLLLKLVALMACVERTLLEREIGQCQTGAVVAAGRLESSDKDDKTDDAQAKAAAHADTAATVARLDQGKHIERAALDDGTLNANNDHIVCEVKDFSCGFFLIDGPEKLVLQFFRHYGHPVRNQKVGNRLAEIICMVVVCSFIVVYPGALLAFIWAPMQVQWVWLGYLFYSMVAMHLYRFNVCGGKHIATTEAQLARALHTDRQVILTDLSGHKVLAKLNTESAKKVSIGKQKVESLVASIYIDR